MFGEEDSLNLHDYLDEQKILKKDKMPEYKDDFTSFEHWWQNVVRTGDIFTIPGYVKGTMIPGYSEGGVVDYTGLAMVHGSSSKPEAFLNAEQTEIFSRMSKELSAKGANSAAGSSPINIENITIQTQQLNNKQDFDAAGKVLADAFGKAIGRRGISVNAKR